MAAQNRWNVMSIILGIVVLVGLYLAKLYNYLLFHTLVEGFSVVIGIGIFVVAWNARQFMANNYFLFVGIASLFVGVVDFMHALAYKGMGVFPGFASNLPTQLWIVARYIQASSFLAAPFFLDRKLKPRLTVTAYLAATSLLLVAIFAGAYPECFIEGQGLTPFKKGSEYLVALMLVGALTFMQKKAKAFDREVARLLSFGIGTFIASELAFTLYADVYGITNMVGHLLKFGGFYFIYKAIIETGLARPYNLLFRELKESEERFRRIVETAQEGVWAIDSGSRITYVNKRMADMLSYGLDEMIGRQVFDFCTEDGCREINARLENRKLGVREQYETTMLRNDGPKVWVSISAVPIWDESGQYAGSFAMISDITGRKRMDEEIEVLHTNLSSHAFELEEANRALAAANHELEAFSYTVSHDLRSPLTCINGYAQLIATMYADRLDEQGKGIVAGIRSAADRMEQFISTLLNFSRLTRSEINRTSVDLGELAHEVAGQLRMNEPSRRVVFTIADGLKADGDPRLLRAVLENMIGNAWKYTGKREEASIEFGMVEQEGKTAFFVRDNGAGFDMAEADRLFAPFQRLHGREEFEGSGIGLATVRRIIERHGGRVWAEGEPGKGATFYFTLG
ncbi:MAG: PAS domain S-box protein [Geobacter sp.]|nr:PAS domain S-box protein [Geobacter sp.]